MKRNSKEKESKSEKQKQSEGPDLTDTEVDYLTIVADEIRSRASIQQAVADLSEICWNKCISKPPGNYLTTNEQKCLQYCVHRFVETSNFILLRLNQIGARLSKMLGEEDLPPPTLSDTEMESELKNVENENS
jgi:import inner membrane translocase subunit TIM8